MDKEKSIEFKQLIKDEIEIRERFRAARKELEALIYPTTKHVRACNKFWNIELPNAEEIIVIMDNGTALKIKRPKDEIASCESYLPFGIDFSECEVINVE